MGEIPPPPPSVDILILGAGWTSTFLTPLLQSHSISYAATTTTGRDNTIPFKFDPTSSSLAPYKALPAASLVLITFPIQGKGVVPILTGLYATAHHDDPQDRAPAAQVHPRWLALGSTRGFNADGWNSDSTPYDATNERGIAEAELLALFPTRAVVLNLAGLYGGARDPRNWIPKIAPQKEALRAKGALHLVHGDDVARAVLAVYETNEREHAKVYGKRWILADLHCYDWWDLILTWAPEVRRRVAESKGVDEAEKLQYEEWITDLMDEQGVKGLPRAPGEMGRLLDSRAFWKAVKLVPKRRHVLS